MNSPTVRSLKKLRDEGYTCQVVEHFNSFVKIRQDLFNFIDIVAIRSDVPGVLGVQTTSRSNTSARVKKITDNPISKTWLSAGNKIEVHGWSKMGARGKVKHWNCFVEEMKGTI